MAVKHRKQLEDHTIRLANRLIGENNHTESMVNWQFERFLREMERRK